MHTHCSQSQCWLGESEIIKWAMYRFRTISVPITCVVSWAIGFSPDPEDLLVPGKYREVYSATRRSNGFAAIRVDEVQVCRLGPAWAREFTAFQDGTGYTVHNRPPVIPLCDPYSRCKRKLVNEDP